MGNRLESAYLATKTAGGIDHLGDHSHKRPSLRKAGGRVHGAIRVWVRLVGIFSRRDGWRRDEASGGKCGPSPLAETREPGQMAGPPDPTFLPLDFLARPASRMIAAWRTSRETAMPLPLGRRGREGILDEQYI